MVFNKARKFLLDGGIVYLYALFIAGYFLLPMAAGHRRVYYLLLMPAAALLWRELRDFYRGNQLAKVVLLYAGYMMCTLAWSADFAPLAALEALWYTLAVLSFVALSGYLWRRYAGRMDLMQRRALWLAAGTALVSIVWWYARHPFPATRLEPLGIMHDPNESGSVYGMFFIAAIHALVVAGRRCDRVAAAAIAVALLALVLFTQSRTALAGVCVGLLALFGWRALGLIALAAAASWTLLAANHLMWKERVLTFSYRPGIWREVLEDAGERPWFGHGYLVDTAVAAYGKVFDHAHDSYLATLRDGGAVGLVLLAVLLGWAARWAWRLRNDCREPVYLALLLYGATCISMDFDRLLVQPKEIWLFFWLPLALVIASRGERPPPSVRQLFPLR